MHCAAGKLTHCGSSGNFGCDTSRNGNAHCSNSHNRAGSN